MGGGHSYVELSRADSAERPMSDMSIATDDSNFVRTMLLPLHLRPKYKMALAARRQQDVPQVVAMRAWMTEHWYPRQTVPLIPCLPSQSPWYRPPASPLERDLISNFQDSLDVHRRSLRADAELQVSDRPADRRRLHGAWTPASKRVVDFAQHFTCVFTPIPIFFSLRIVLPASFWADIVRLIYSFENIASEDRADWLQSCPYRGFDSDDRWRCGTASTSAAECGRLLGCEWQAARCVESVVFPDEARCCSRGNWTRIGGSNISRGTRVSQASGGWLSSFSDVTYLHGSGTVEELEDYIQSDTYLTDESPLIAAAIVVEKMESGQWVYTIRLNSSFVGDEPSTASAAVDYLETQVKMKSAFGYVQSKGPSFIALQLLMDRYILQTPADVVQALTDSQLEDICPDLNCP